MTRRARFDYRPFVVNWCIKVRVLDGSEVTDKEGSETASNDFLCIWILLITLACSMTLEVPCRVFPFYIVNFIMHWTKQALHCVCQHWLSFHCGAGRHTTAYHQSII